jgi:hypothetical protein
MIREKGESYVDIVETQLWKVNVQSNPEGRYPVRKTHPQKGMYKQTRKKSVLCKKLTCKEHPG